MNDTNQQGDAIHRAIKGMEARGPAAISVGWAYMIAALLTVLPPIYIIGDPLGVLANLKLLDEFWIIFGDYFANGDLEISLRPLTWTAFFLSIGLLILAYRIRGTRQNMVAKSYGIEADNHMHCFFFGRGMNILFPFGPGDHGYVQALARGGADKEAAMSTAYYYRVFEMLSIIVFFSFGVILMGWYGSLLAILFSVTMFIVMTVMIRPLGRSDGGSGLLDALGLRTVSKATAAIFKTPSFAIKVLAVSVLALLVELLAITFMKRAFSSIPMELMLGQGVPMGGYFIALAVANLARVVPFTPGGMGVFEVSFVTTLSFFGAAPVEVAPIIMADGFFTNIIILAGMIIAIRKSDMPTVLGSWRAYFSTSARRIRGDQTDVSTAFATE